MSKGNSPTRLDPINLPRRLREGLDKASDLLEKGKAAEALDILEELDERHPNQVYVLEMLADACYDLQDNRGYLRAMQSLHRLTPNRAEAKIGLAEAYMVNHYLALALITFREYLKRWPQHEHTQEVRKTVQKLEEGLPEILEDAGLDFESDLDFAVQNEEVQVCLSSGEFGRGKALIEKLLRQKPDFVPPLNNLSQIYWLEGDLLRAIESSQRVLTIQPDNIHALANLARYLYTTGRKEEAAPIIERLKTSQAKASERWLKIAETLAFIGDDAGMIELAEQAVKEAHPLELNGYFYHFWAVSEALRGHENAAKKHWQHSLRLDPTLALARENLDDLKMPKHEQNGPWAFPLAQMLPQTTIREMARVVEHAAKSKDKDAFQPTIQRFLDLHPELLQLTPLLLERGDRQAKEFVINVADMSAHPAFLALLKDFAFGQKGSDEMRLKAAQVLSKYKTAPSSQVQMWIKGQWSPILLLGFEITPEPILDEAPLVPKALGLMKKAIYALRDENWAEAESHLRKALAVQPEHPGLLNNLALALGQQDKTEEADALLKHITEDFPDYFFGQMALARISIQGKEYDKARSILNHWMEKKKCFHVTEFNMLCKTQIDLMLAEDQIDGALSWMEMWERTEPEDDTDFEKYRAHLEIAQLLSKLKKRQTKSRKPKKE